MSGNTDGDYWCTCNACDGKIKFHARTIKRHFIKYNDGLQVGLLLLLVLKYFICVFSKYEQGVERISLDSKGQASAQPKYIILIDDYNLLV